MTDTKTIVYESAALAEAMDIGTLIPIVIIEEKEGVLISIKLVHDLEPMYNGNTPFKKEVDGLLYKRECHETTCGV